MESSTAGQLDPDKSLPRRLAAILPKDVPFGIYHVSTPPRKTDALCSAPPDERPDRTYCENHFLAVSINVDSKPEAPSQHASPAEPASPKQEVIILGVEIFIYTTAHATTLFVSKADSTGYLPLLNLPKGTPSPIRQVCAAFIEHLVETRRRQGVQFIISLFARAQGQYLFPGSVDHGGKHVLDDRGLIKWWCRVLDPLLTSPPSGKVPVPPWDTVNGYLVVPGLDTYETRAFIPRSPTASSSWSLAHPLEKISHYCREFDWVPPRCLIPRFPDDPKSRFRDELDGEAGHSGAMKKTGSWRSVKTLDMFWEMMAFRQECSSGRMTGFIWVVFDDKAADAEDPNQEKGGQDETITAPATPPAQTNGALSVTAPETTPRKLFPSQSDGAAKPGGKKIKSKRRKIKLRGPIKPRQPKAKTAQRNHLPQIPIKTAYYYWPSRGRGERIVNEKTYKRIVEHMLHTNFSTLEKAVGSSRRWIREVGIGSEWGSTVTGERELPASVMDGAESAAEVNNLSGLVKRKRADTAEKAVNGVNILSADLVRRASRDESQHQLASRTEANVLSAGLVRKRPKT